MKRKLVVAFSIFMICCSLFVGCSKESGTASATGSTTTTDTGKIRVVTFFAGSDQWAPVWKEVIAEYMEAHPGVTIVDESQPTAGANDLFRTKIQSEIAAQTPPDLMLFYNGADGQMVMDSDLFVDFSSYMAEDTEWASHLKPAAMAAGNLDGVQYCIPYIGYYEGLLYNKGLFDKYGLAEPTTWENILASIDTLKANGITPFAVSMAKPTYMCELFVLAQVGAVGQKNYFDPSWAPAFNAIKQLYEMGAFPADTMTLSEDDVRVLFADEKAAMMINGSWTIANLKSNENMRIISMPALPGGVGGADCALSGFGSGWYMSKEAASRDNLTIDFLKYLTSPEVMTKFIAAGGSPAIDCNVPEGATNLEASAVNMLNTATQQVQAIDSQVTRESWLHLIEPGLQYIVTGQKSAEALLKEAKALNGN